MRLESDEMESTQRSNSPSVASPPKPMYRRSTSLPIPDDCDGKGKANADALISNNSCRGVNDVKRKAVFAGTRPQQKQSNCSTTRSEFLGFGAIPPRLNAKSKQCLKMSSAGENSMQSTALLKDAERLVQIILQNDTLKISQETISKAIQQNAVLQSKKRYSSLIEKPWRAASKSVCESAEYNSVDVREKSMTKVFRRSLSSDSFVLPSSIDELVHSKKALEQANERILLLQKDLEKVHRRKKTTDNPMSDGDSLSSTNIEDDDEIVALATTASFVPDTFYDTIEPPLDIVRTPSPEHYSRKKAVGSVNVVSRLEYRALQIRNEQLLQKISLLENELSPDAMNGPNNDIFGSSIPDLSSNPSEREAISDILSRLSNVDKSKQVDYMEAKIVALIKQLQQSESKCRVLADNEIVAKATIENLSTQLLECEQKAKESNERLTFQAENMLKQSNNDVLRMEQELTSAREELSLLKSAKLASESKCLQLEQMQAKVVSSLQSQLNHSESKSERLQDEVNNLMATAVELIQVKTECELLENRLRQSENRVLKMQSDEDSIKQTAIQDAQQRADVRIAQLEVLLAEANNKNEIETQRLINLEMAQAKEQEILSEELRESETTIACLMEEITSLKLLTADIVALEKLLQEKQADYEMKETELGETTAALIRSEADVEELRNELGMLTSLPEIVRKMEKELKIAQSKLESSGETRFDVTDKATERNQNIADHNQLLELREAYFMAEEEVTELRNQLNLLKPLASDLENAEQELRETCAKLDKAELEVGLLTDKLDMMQTALADLNEAELELTQSRAFLSLREQELQECRSSLSLRDQELQECRDEVSALHSKNTLLQLSSQHLPLSEREVLEADFEQRRSTLSRTVVELETKVLVLEQDLLEETKKKIAADDALAHVERQLSEANARSLILLAEIDDLNKKSRTYTAGSACHTSLAEVEDTSSLVQHLQEQPNLRDEEISKLNLSVADQETLIRKYNEKGFEMERELSFNESRISELTAFVAKQQKIIDAAEAKSSQLTVKYAALITDRDKLRKNLAVLQANVQEFEREVKERDAVIQDLLLRQKDDAFIENLQNEKKRTLERCSDLSLQLAESQFKIDRLTEQLRSMQKREIVLQEQTTSVRPGTSFQSIINTSIDRISSRLDESIRSSNKRTSSNITITHDQNLYKT